jgi:predicted cupin superfamily sugar epimerase
MARAHDLIAALGMQPHPEGGHYVEVYRSPSLTTIFFLLSAGDISRWHRVRSADEAWHFYEGDPLELIAAGTGFDRLDTQRLGPVGPEVRPVHVVPAGVWQAARSTGAFTLVGCSVGPAFAFENFDMLRNLPDMAAEAVRRLPEAAAFL